MLVFRPRSKLSQRRAGICSPLPFKYRRARLGSPQLVDGYVSCRKRTLWMTVLPVQELILGYKSRYRLSRWVMNGQKDEREKETRKKRDDTDPSEGNLL